MRLKFTTRFISKIFKLKVYGIEVIRKILDPERGSKNCSADVTLTKLDGIPIIGNLHCVEKLCSSAQEKTREQLERVLK